MYKSEILGVANDIHKRYVEKIINMLVISEYMTEYVAEHLQISKWLTVVVWIFVPPLNKLKLTSQCDSTRCGSRGGN